MLAQAGGQASGGGLYRPNLRYRVLRFAGPEARYATALRLARDTAGAGIIHVDSMATAERLCRQLRDAGDSACSYHGMLAPATRRLRLRQFRQGARRVMVATPAFGGGMDRHDIRFVIHLRVPASLQAYYRDSCRAGRDGLPAQCTLLAPPHGDLGEAAPLAAYLRGGACRWHLLLAGLGADGDDGDACGQCDHCGGAGLTLAAMPAHPPLDLAALLTVAGERIMFEFAEDSGKTFMAEFLPAR
ncbi:MAG TPA: helicase-related protein [Burkholderiaceae bacterium]|nr:helicase-related protein [Burkholderiaceae bacterium]